MFEQAIRDLEEAIDGLDIPVDGPALVACMGLLDRLNAKITCAVGAFDRAELWRDSGATSMTAWLRNAARRSGREAASCTRTARRLADLPVLSDAYCDGTVSTAQVQAVVANLDDDTTPLFAWTETELVPTLAGLSVCDVSNAMQHWAQAAKDSLHDPADPDLAQPERRLHLSLTLDGRRELSASLDPEAGALAEAALRVAQTDDCDGEPPRTPAQRRADALVDILRFYLDHQQHRRGGRHRPHLNILLNYHDLIPPPDPASTTERPPPNGSSPNEMGQPGDNVTGGGEPLRAGSLSNGMGQLGGSVTGGGGPPRAGSSSVGTGQLGDSVTGGGGPPRAGSASVGTGQRGGGVSRGGGRLLDGTVLDGVTIRRLACDAGIHRVVTDGRSSILDYGWTTRTVPVNLYNALVARDQHCRFPGCDRPPQYCEAHHVQHWEHGGPTRLDNLVLECSRHHHLLHSPGWSAELKPDGTLLVTNPNGQILESPPPGKPPDLYTRAWDLALTST